jgi:hypothetical protein
MSSNGKDWWNWVVGESSCVMLLGFSYGWMSNLNVQR